MDGSELDREDVGEGAEHLGPGPEVRHLGGTTRTGLRAAVTLGVVAALTVAAAGVAAIAGDSRDQRVRRAVEPAVGDRLPAVTEHPVGATGHTRAADDGAAGHDVSEHPVGAPDQTHAAEDVAAGHDIPDHFPLGVAHEDLTGDGGAVTGPGSDVPGPEALPVCGTTVWSVPATDRFGFSSTGPAGYADVRELRTFADAEDAVDQVNEIRTMMAGCHREVRDGAAIRWILYAEDTGYDSVTFGSTYEDGLGGVIFQVTRVGRSVVALARAGEWSPETAPQGAAELTAITRQIAPAMCSFTEAGC